MEQDKVLAAIDNLRNDIVQAIKDSEQRIIEAGKLEIRSSAGSEPRKPYAPDSLLGQVMGDPQPSPFGKDSKKR